MVKHASITPSAKIEKNLVARRRRRRLKRQRPASAREKTVGLTR
jgi:hypothetical protein